MIKTTGLISKIYSHHVGDILLISFNFICILKV